MAGVFYSGDEITSLERLIAERLRWGRKDLKNLHDSLAETCGSTVMMEGKHGQRIIFGKVEAAHL
jgi:hypothetical protein